MTTDTALVTEEMIEAAARCLSSNSYGAVDVARGMTAWEATRRRAEEALRAVAPLIAARAILQMNEGAIAAVAAEREHCAKVMLDKAQEYNRVRNKGMANHCRSLAAAMRGRDPGSGEFVPVTPTDPYKRQEREHIERAIAAERERCAKIVRDYFGGYAGDHNLAGLEAAIRRGETT